MEDKLANHLKPELEEIPTSLLFTDGNDFGVNHRPLDNAQLAKIRNNLFNHKLLDKNPIVLWFSKFEHYKVAEGQHAVAGVTRSSWLCKVIDGDGSTDEHIRELAHDHGIKESQSSTPSRYFQECNDCHTLHERFRRDQAKKGSKSMKGLYEYIQNVFGSFSDDQVESRLLFYKKMKRSSDFYDEDYSEIHGEPPNKSLLEECVKLNLNKGQTEKHVAQRLKDIDEFDDDDDTHDYNPIKEIPQPEQPKKDKYETDNIHIDEIDPKEASADITINQLENLHIENQTQREELEAEKEKRIDLEKLVDKFYEELKSVKEDNKRLKKKYNSLARKYRKPKPEPLLAVDE